MEFRTRTLPVKVRMDNDGKPKVIEGYAAVFYDGTRATEYELWPGTIERIMPGAFDGRLGDDVRALFNHDTSKLLGRNGKTLRLSVDAKGLRYEIDVAPTSTCDDVLVYLERGDISGSSFAFRGAKSTWSLGEDDTSTREITSIDQLFDVGPVTDPAYVGTTAGARHAESVAEARQAYEAAKKQRDDELIEAIRAENRRRADRLTLIDLGG